MTKVAVIGAGLSGLVVARRLAPVADVTLYEKSRGPGGRIATRYAGEFEFDHGAQFFTARSREFRAFIQPLIHHGIVAEWRADCAEYDGSTMTRLRPWSEDDPRLVGAPRMNSLGKALAAALPVSAGATIIGIARGREGWTLSHANGDTFGPFDWLVMASPSAQTAVLAQDFPELVNFCATRRMLGCYALMLGFTDDIELDWQLAEVRNAGVRLIAVNSSKPGRGEPLTLVVHSSNAWAESHMDDSADAVREHLLAEASSVMGQDLSLATHSQVHRWRYANTSRQSGPAYFLDEDNRLAACGDWCVGGRVEAAFTSACALAETLLDRIRPR